MYGILGILPTLHKKYAEILVIISVYFLYRTEQKIICYKICA